MKKVHTRTESCDGKQVKQLVYSTDAAPEKVRPVTHIKYGKNKSPISTLPFRLTVMPSDEQKQQIADTIRSSVKKKVIKVFFTDTPECKVAFVGIDSMGVVRNKIDAILRESEVRASNDAIAQL